MQAMSTAASGSAVCPLVAMAPPPEDGAVLGIVALDVAAPDEPAVAVALLPPCAPSR